MKNDSTINQINNELTEIKAQAIPGENIFPELNKLEYVNIEQQQSCIDCLCPDCTNNEYVAVNPTTKQRLYEFREDSHICERSCCFSCRGFVMNIRNREGVSVIVDIEGHKGCSLPCFCTFGCGKPTIKCNVKTPAGYKLGHVKFNFDSACCALWYNRIDIYTGKDFPKYRIKRHRCCIACHLGIWAKCCDCSYDIYEENAIVGEVVKLQCSSFFTFCPKSDNYQIRFPLNATPDEKMLLLIGTLLLDYTTYYS